MHKKGEKKKRSHLKSTKMSKTKEILNSEQTWPSMELFGWQCFLETVVFEVNASSQGMFWQSGLMV